MLSVINLNKTFSEKRVINNMSFDLREGEIVALLGPNGAGKTTLMRLITSFYEPDSGDVCINGNSIYNNRTEALKQIGYVPENGILYPELTVFEYIKFMADIRRIPYQNFVDNLVSLIQQLDISSVINQKCETLSKGFKRRIGIAGALIHKPQILILDEPTEGLDPNQKFFIRNFIKEYSKNSIILISTHIMEEVDALADRVILINHGKIIRNLSPERLKKTTSSGDIESAFRFATTSVLEED